MSDDIEKKEVGSVSEFLAALKSPVGEECLCGAKETLFYRGQSNRAYKPVPSISRKGVNGEFIYSKEDERKSLLELGAYFQADFRGKTAFERLVLAQHYGLPTRLLDVTLNPLVALYFACKGDSDKNGVVFAYSVQEDAILSPDSDRLRVLANLAYLSEEWFKVLCEKIPSLEWLYDEDKLKDRITILPEYKEGEKNGGTYKDDSPLCSANGYLMHLIRAEYPAFENVIIAADLRRYYFIKPIYSNSRIRAQSGGFVITGLERDYAGFSCPNFSELAYHKQTHKICILKDAKKKILNELDTLSINDLTLFPELEHGANYLKEKYKKQ